MAGKAFMRMDTRKSEAVLIVVNILQHIIMVISRIVTHNPEN
jgi:hypothetical protein